MHRLATTLLGILAFTSGARAGAVPLQTLRDQVETEKPGLLLIGNSMVREGLDDEILQRLTGLTVSRFYSSGALTAWQALALKNVVGKTKHRPDVVVLVTRENFLTWPSLRAGSKATGMRGYKRNIDALRDGPEPILDAIAYQRPAENYHGPAPYRRGPWNFGEAVDDSLLPHMLQWAHDRGVMLVIARHKASRSAKGSPRYVADTATHRLYREDLATYVTEHGAAFLDYTVAPALRGSHYRHEGNDDHLNEAGRKVWSRLLGRDLTAILEGRKAPNQQTGQASWRPLPRPDPPAERSSHDSR